MLRSGLIALGFACVLLSACSEENAPEEAIKVVVVPVVRGDVTVHGEYVGRTQASERVEVNPRIDGFLEAIEFVEGSTVEAGTTLYRIDARPYEAQVKRAAATLASRKAQLEKFKRDVARIGPLYEEDAASQLDYDVAVSSVETGEAQVREAEADLARAQFELDYTEIKAPIGGVVGASRVDVGALIQAGDRTPLTTISLIEPIFVTFSMSALDYLTARRRVHSVSERRESEIGGKALEGEISITLPDDSIYQYTGRVSFTDPQVSPETGTFQVRAVLPNPDRELLPGQFTRVRMPVSVSQDALLIPEESTVVAQGGIYVMVVLPNNRVERRLIVPGPIVDGRMIVSSGLSEGERIIVQGINRVYHGSLAEPITPQQHAAEVAAQQNSVVRSATGDDPETPPVQDEK